MPYSQRWIKEHTDQLLADIPKFKQVAEDSIGIIGVMHASLGMDATALGECIQADETGQLAEIVHEHSRRRVEGIEKSLFELARGEITASSQRVTAMMAILNNRHGSYGMQRVQHSGSVQYVAPAGAGEVQDDDGTPTLKLFKATGTEDGKP
jgi:hypothetical protein